MKLRALVIDDSRIMRNMVMESLRKTNLAEFEFTEAGDGSEALDRFDPDLVDVVFADWNMPQLNGIEFARHVRSMRSASHIPVIMITSESASGKQAAAYEEARITCYITKPFTVDEMKNKLTPIIQDLANKQSQKEKATPKPAAVQPAATKPAGGFFGKLLGKG